jgi:hypothetical protein
MYKPAAKRRWGYFALPILYGDRLVGKLDATADRKAGVLRVDAIHQDVAFNKRMTTAVDREIKDLAQWLELDLTLPGLRSTELQAYVRDRRHHSTAARRVANVSPTGRADATPRGPGLGRGAHVHAHRRIRPERAGSPSSCPHSRPSERAPT